VVAGPAEHKIHSFDIEIRAGEVYVQPHKEKEDKAA
jgi:hypothetical protein